MMSASVVVGELFVRELLVQDLETLVPMVAGVVRRAGADGGDGSIRSGRKDNEY